MSAWPTFHRDGTVTVHGDVVGRKYVSGLNGFRFTCNCGHVSTLPMARSLRRAVSAHLETTEHVDRSQHITFGAIPDPLEGNPYDLTPGEDYDDGSDT